MNSKIFKVSLLIGFLLFGISCERDLSDDVAPATLSTTAEIFTDTFIGMGSNFYFPFVPDGAKPDVFSVDDTEGFESEASIRIDVPNADDPAGGFAGAAFVVDGDGRDLSGYDALTFWAKATQAATIGTIGFGSEFNANAVGLDFTTNWTKFIIPIPDPSKMTDERTVFFFGAGGILYPGLPQGQEVGYTFWIDELKYESLGTVAQPRPAIMNGEDVVTETFIGSTGSVTGLSHTFNLGNGIEQTVFPSTSFYAFTTSTDSVITIDEFGNYTVIGDGTVEITAQLANVRAAGSLTLQSLGDFEFADTPPFAPENVLSIFSDTYSNIAGFSPVVFNNSELFVALESIGGETMIRYENLGFVGMGWDGSSDISTFDSLYVDIQVVQGFSPADGLIVELNSGGSAAGGYLVPGSQLARDAWRTVTIPLNGFTRPTGGGGQGNPDLNSIVNVTFVGSGISNVRVDNVIFFKAN